MVLLSSVIKQSQTLEIEIWLSLISWMVKVGKNGTFYRKYIARKPPVMNSNNNKTLDSWISFPQVDWVPHDFVVLKLTLQANNKCGSQTMFQ